MSVTIHAFPQFTRWGPQREADRLRLAKLFAGKSKDDMRKLWDTVGEDSFSGPYDCADIHSYMNMLGDGEYCAV
jgi:ferritin-like protein